MLLMTGFTDGLSEWLMIIDKSKSFMKDFFLKIFHVNTDQNIWNLLFLNILVKLF